MGKGKENQRLSSSKDPTGVLYLKEEACDEGTHVTRESIPSSSTRTCSRGTRIPLSSTPYLSQPLSQILSSSRRLTLWEPSQKLSLCLLFLGPALVFLRLL